MKKIIVKSILDHYNLHPVIILDKDLDVKAKYIPEEDKVIIKDIPPEKTNPKHMLDARNLGISKFLKKYAQAGTVAVYCDKDYHDDNKWEIRAEKWAHKEYNGYWSEDREETKGAKFLN